ncbi:hypothetical protein QYF36_003008 [Acer negundo]|nr:hypothetical protein QYF36_003008 [Acer negundo]
MFPPLVGPAKSSAFSGFLFSLVIPAKSSGALVKERISSNLSLSSGIESSNLGRRLNGTLLSSTVGFGAVEELLPRLRYGIDLYDQSASPVLRYEEDSSPPARYGFLKLVHDLSSRNSSRAFGVCTTRHRSIETTLLGLLPMPLSSVSPTRASKPTRLSSGTLFYLLCSFLVLYRTWPLIKGLAFPLSSIVTGWLCPPIVSMNRFLNFPSLRNELSSYLIPKQDSRSLIAGSFLPVSGRVEMFSENTLIGAVGHGRELRVVVAAIDSGTKRTGLLGIDPFFSFCRAKQSVIRDLAVKFIGKLEGYQTAGSTSLPSTSISGPLINTRDPTSSYQTEVNAMNSPARQADTAGSPACKRALQPHTQDLRSEKRSCYIYKEAAVSISHLGSFAAGNAWSLAAPFRTLNFTFNSVCVSYRLFNLHKATWRGNRFYGQVLTFNALGRLDLSPLLAYLTRGMVPPNLRQPDLRPSSLIEQVKREEAKYPYAAPLVVGREVQRNMSTG